MGWNWDFTQLTFQAILIRTQKIFRLKSIRSKASLTKAVRSPLPRMRWNLPLATKPACFVNGAHACAAELNEQRFTDLLFLSA